MICGFTLECEFANQEFLGVISDINPVNPLKLSTIIQR